MDAARLMHDKVNILLVDDQPAKLLANEEILRDLGENLVTAASAREALEFLLKNDAAVVLIDVCMPELDGFELAAMIRDHPRFKKTAIIFISAIQVDDVDRLRGYELGAVDYVPVPMIPELLRAKVRVFAELYRKTRELERLNAELEHRVAKRTEELEASNKRLLASEEGRSLALASGQMGSWEWDLATDEWKWDEGQSRIFGIDRGTFRLTLENMRAMIHPDDWERLKVIGRGMSSGTRTQHIEFRALRPDGSVRWCIGTAVATLNAADRAVRVSGVTVDITERKEAQQRQDLLAREVDHRARNALAVVQSIIRLTRAGSVEEYVAAVDGRIKALARAHTLLSDSRWHSADLAVLVMEELAPYQGPGMDKIKIGGPNVSLPPYIAQGLALAAHELVTNAAKHGALSSTAGTLSVTWQTTPDSLLLQWMEKGGPRVVSAPAGGFGLKVIRGSIEGQLGGKAAFAWEQEGMQCTLSIPRGEAVNLRPSSAARATQKGSAPGKQFSGQRVLLVEDEALVAMMIQEYLTECGYSVLGPIARASEALAVAKGSAFDLAILDINLGDGLAYPVADLLSARGVPFVFVTGYEADTVDDRFREIPVLQKPIERRMLQKLFSTNGKGAPAVRHALRDMARMKAGR